MPRLPVLTLLALLPLLAGPTLSVRGRCFYLDGRPFPYTGLSFLNALFNPAFQASPEARREWFAKFKEYGINNEPARNGTTQFGGPGEQTYPADHILQIFEVWKIGAYPACHHDMFQMGAGSASVPPSGIPDPEFNPYHRAVFEFLALRERYAPQACGE